MDIKSGRWMIRNLFFEMPSGNQILLICLYIYVPLSSILHFYLDFSFCFFYMRIWIECKIVTLFEYGTICIEGRKFDI